MDRAKAAILRAKTSIRESLRELEEAHGDKSYLLVAVGDGGDEASASDDEGIGEEEVRREICGHIQEPQERE